MPDVAWFSAQHVAEARDEFAVSRAPEICAEVLSPWNAWGEIEEKIGVSLDKVSECHLEQLTAIWDALN